MDEDTEQAAWHQQELDEQQEQEILRADPAYREWLESIEACASKEEMYGDHGG
jgi:hypothetical protein